MTIEDWFIVGVLMLSVLVGIAQGFFRSAFSLGGLLAGLATAAWHYQRVAALLLTVVKIEAIANAVGFMVIALAVMAICSILGTLLYKAFRKLGLGCIDRLGGAVFGLVQGVLLVTLCLVVAIAFFPQSAWLNEAALPRQFYGLCWRTTDVSPADLAERLRSGLRALEERPPGWLSPDADRERHAR